jgi:hypothetical protein
LCPEELVLGRVFNLLSLSLPLAEALISGCLLLTTRSKTNQMRIPTKAPSKVVLNYYYCYYVGANTNTWFKNTMHKCFFLGLRRVLRSSLYRIVIIVKRCHWV